MSRPCPREARAAPPTPSPLQPPSCFQSRGGHQPAAAAERGETRRRRRSTRRPPAGCTAPAKRSGWGEWGGGATGRHRPAAHSALGHRARRGEGESESAAARAGSRTVRGCGPRHRGAARSAPTALCWGGRERGHLYAPRLAVRRVGAGCVCVRRDSGGAERVEKRAETRVLRRCVHRRTDGVCHGSQKPVAWRLCAPVDDSQVRWRVAARRLPRPSTARAVHGCARVCLNSTKLNRNAAWPCHSIQTRAGGERERATAAGRRLVLSPTSLRVVVFTSGARLTPSPH